MTKHLARELSLPAATALVVGQVIAVGIFLTSGMIIRTIASPIGVLLIWGGMGAMAICGALCYGALAARYPQAGGGYVYLREAYGPRLAFLYGWKCLLIMDPGVTAALATGFASYAAYLFPLGPVGMRVVAMGAIAAFAAVHITGVKLGARLLTVVSVLKLALLFALMAGALLSAAGSWAHLTPFVGRRAGAPPLLGALAGAYVAAFFTFGGWWDVMRIAGEVRDPIRTLPRALWLGLTAIAVVYAATTLSFNYLIPSGQVIDGHAFVAQVGAAVFGRGGGLAVAVIVIVCVLGSLGVTQMLSPRLYVAMAEDGLFPSSAAAVHPRFGTPARAILTQAVLASVLVALGTFDTIVAYFVFITVVFVAATVASVFVFRRRDPAFAVPGYPLTPVVFLALVAVLLALVAMNNPWQSLLGLVVVAAAVPVYQIIWHSRRSPRLGETTP